MKRNQVRFLLVLVISAMSAFAASTANAQLVAGWQFEEGSGSVAKDLKGYGIDLTLYGDTGWDADVPPVLVGKSTRSLRFDGNGDYCEAPAAADSYMNPSGAAGTQRWTLMCWERTNVFVNNATFMDKMYNYRIAEYSNQLEAMCRTVPQANEYATGGALGNTDWHHVAATYDGRYLVGYVDGVEVNRNDAGGPLVEQHSVFRIGGGSISWGVYFNGKIDDAAVFLQVLTVSQIRDMMNNGIETFVNAPANLAPYIDTGPAWQIVVPPMPVPPLWVVYPGELELNGVAADNSLQPPENPVPLTAYWEVVDGPEGGNITFAADPNILVNTAYFTPNITGVYHLRLYATDGVLEKTGLVEVEVKHYNYTGLQNHWKFDNNLQDTAPMQSPHSTTNDYLESRGAVAPFYGPGIDGQAIHVGETNYTGGWCWLETAFGTDSADVELSRAFTVEMYVKPQLEKATTEGDQLEWQDLVGKWFVYTAGQETYFESYEFIVNYGRIGLNKADVADIINKPRNMNWNRTSTLLGPYAFPRAYGWQHIAFVGNGLGSVTFYIDGEAKGTGQYPSIEFVNSNAPLRVANVLVNANGGVGRASPYVGWIDDLKFFQYNKPRSYLLNRARLIPIQGPIPEDGYQLAYPDVVLGWSRVKGYPDEIPTYDVYFARDGQSLTLAVSGIIDTTYDPFEAGAQPLLNYDTTYRWKVIAQTSTGPNSSAEWTFKTIPVDFLGLEGTALIGYWKLDEGTGTDAHDSAGADDVGRYRYPAVGGGGPPQWIPGWIAANPATALRFRNFEYLVVVPVDFSQYFNLPKGDYTLATWMKTTPIFNFTSVDFIGFGLSYSLGRNGTTEYAQFYHGGFSGSVTNGTTPIGDGYWHHVAAVYNAPTPVKSTIVSLYVDGKLDATEAVDGNHNFGALTDQLLLCANSQEPYNFNGALDDVRIYRRALSAAEVKELFDRGIVNLAPSVHAGTNVIVPFPGLTVDLQTKMRDDSAPLQTNPRISWIQLDGPEGVIFDPCIIEAGNMPGFVKNVDNILTTTLTFPSIGFYKVRFKADDTIYTHADDVRIWVQAAGDVGTTVAYWRYEEDTPETDYRGSGDDPNTIVIANEVASGLPLVGTRSAPQLLPDLHTTVMQSVIPLTGAANNYHLGEGPGNVNYFGGRLGTSGMSITMEAQTWDGMVFCEDGVTVECYIKLDEQNWTVYDMMDAGKGLAFFNSTASPTNRLRFQFYVETATPNLFRLTTVVSDILVYQMGWMHVAFTYDKTTGAARVYKNGIPAWLTHHDDGAGAGMLEYTPWADHWQGEPGRTFVLQENLNLFVSTGVDTVPSGFDELRITAEPLWAQRLLVKGPAECAEKLQGDLDGDCDVDVYDLKLFCDSWLICNNADPTDCFK